MWNRPKHPPPLPWAEQGRIGYLILYLMGVPVGLLLVLWLIFGNNLLGPG